MKKVFEERYNNLCEMRENHKILV